MTQNSGDAYRSMWMLGAAMMLPLLLLGGPLAGYFFGNYLLVKRLGLPEFSTALCVLLGIAGSGMQAYRLIKEIKEKGEKEDRA